MATGETRTYTVFCLLCCKNNQVCLKFCIKALSYICNSSAEKLLAGQIGTALKMSTAPKRRLPTVTLCIKTDIASDEEIKNLTLQANEPYFLEGAILPLESEITDSTKYVGKSISFSALNYNF